MAWSIARLSPARARRPLESGKELHDDDSLTEQNYDEALVAAEGLVIPSS
jgi:hypothetical protein